MNLIEEIINRILDGMKRVTTKDYLIVFGPAALFLITNHYWGYI